MKRSLTWLLITLALSILMTPRTAQAHQAAKVARIGWLSQEPPPAGPNANHDAFREGLRMLGWVEGQNLAIEYRWAENSDERLPGLAAELVRLPVDVIVATGTRAVAARIWKGRLPKRSLVLLTRELYEIENEGKTDPSGSQDMIGLIYPGINRLDYDFSANGGVFPSHIETLPDLRAARWLERVLHLLAVAPRPDRYHPLGDQRLTPEWIGRLGETGAEITRAGNIALTCENDELGGMRRAVIAKHPGRVVFRIDANAEEMRLRVHLGA